MSLPRTLLLTLSLFTSGCATSHYTYKRLPGKTAVLADGIAFAPVGAPPPVVNAIVAANQISKMPYKWGGGHKQFEDTGYDCSGASGYVLHAAGLLDSSLPSTGFRRYGQGGEGKWISIYARTDHTFLVIAGLRFDTGWGSERGQGPRWSDSERTTTGAVVRHPVGM